MPMTATTRNKSVNANKDKILSNCIPLSSELSPRHG
jgi:hypothetical protein